MHYSSTIFNQLLQFLPKSTFKQNVDYYKGNYYYKRLTAWNQLVVLLYAQATSKDSLRDTETGLKLHTSHWYHLGINSVARSSIAYANNNRDYRIFEQLFYALLEQCQALFPERSFSFENPLYSFDSTTIILCLSIFDWARYSTSKGAVKIHTLLNNRTIIPELMTITDGKVGDITAIKNISLGLEKGSIIAFDRAYIDYMWWKQLDNDGIFFVSMMKSNQSVVVVGENASSLKSDGILADEFVVFGEYKAITMYPERLRRVRYYSVDKKKEYTYLTNNTDLTALQIALVYKERWQIELFFKWIKQNLHIKTFLGTSENAVLTQIWVAMIYYLLLAYIKHQTKFSGSLLEFTRMIRETLMLHRSLIDILSLSPITLHILEDTENHQPSLF
jgi:hypothetical protein